MKDIEDFYNKIKNIKYGWLDKENNIHENLKEYKEKFIMQDIDNIEKTNHAVCWEMCELQRRFFNQKNINNKTIFAYLKNSRNNACHTFSIFELNNKWYWFEASWQNKKGIHEFNSIEEILEYYKDNFIDFAREEYNREDMEFYDYSKVNSGINCTEFYTHCLSSSKIK